MLKDKSGVKWIWDMFNMITRWYVRLGEKTHVDSFLSRLFSADSTIGRIHAINLESWGHRLMVKTKSLF
jgi:hypothetical protein